MAMLPGKTLLLRRMRRQSRIRRQQRVKRFKNRVDIGTVSDTTDGICTKERISLSNAIFFICGQGRKHKKALRDNAWDLRKREMQGAKEWVADEMKRRKNIED